MAKSRLAIINGQLRFLSRYFLQNEEEVLVHGAEIFSQWIEDKDFVSAIEKHKLEQDFFTFQAVEQALTKAFPIQAKDFLDSFVRLLILDALLGNNDRHHYNWGVITHIKNKYPPRFSPIYDTARGLFWSTPEQNIKIWLSNEQQLKIQLEKYSEGAKPLTGWDENSNINHFQLLEFIFQDGRYKSIFDELVQFSHLEKINRLIDNEFMFLMSSKRRELIKAYLHLRFKRINNIILNS
jgi:HipA-like C-terminal domain